MLHGKFTQDAHSGLTSDFTIFINPRKHSCECTSKGFTCPKCGNHDAARVSVTRRVCGYLGSPDARPFNAGKQEEVKRRVKHLGNGQIG